MTDILVPAAPLEALGRTWKQNAEDRRRVSKSDVMADAIEYCAGELSARIKALRSADNRLTVEQFAKREGVTPQTVRNWIRTEQLPAIDTPKGYRISPDSKRIRRSA